MTSHLYKPTHSKETRLERDMCTPMFIAALFIIARTWKQPKCPSEDKWIRKLWYKRGNATIKRTPQTARIQKGHPKISNLNKMKRQRNTQQIKEQDKCPPNQTKEEEIGNLPDKEF